MVGTRVWIWIWAKGMEWMEVGRGDLGDGSGVDGYLVKVGFTTELLDFRGIGRERAYILNIIGLQ